MDVGYAQVPTCEQAFNLQRDVLGITGGTSFHREGGSVRLRLENPVVEKIILPTGQVEVQGKIVWVLDLSERRTIVSVGASVYTSADMQNYPVEHSRQPIGKRQRRVHRLLTTYNQPLSLAIKETVTHLYSQ